MPSYVILPARQNADLQYPVKVFEVKGSGWGTRVYLWRIHVDIWQNQYNIVKLKNKIKTIIIKKEKRKHLLA